MQFGLVRALGMEHPEGEIAGQKGEIGEHRRGGHRPPHILTEAAQAGFDRVGARLHIAKNFTVAHGRGIADAFAQHARIFPPVFIAILASGEVSGNGWPWSTAARETDWVEKVIPMDYAYGVTRYNAPYDAEGQNNNVSVGYLGVAARQGEAGD